VLYQASTSALVLARRQNTEVLGIKPEIEIIRLDIGVRNLGMEGLVIMIDP